MPGARDSSRRQPPQQVLFNPVPPRMLNLYILLLILCGLSPNTGAVSSQVSETWISSSHNQAALDASVIRRETVAGLSRVRCVALAISLQWPVLACTSQDLVQLCTLWDVQAFKTGSVVKDPTLGPTECKTPLSRFLGCPKPDGSLLPPGTYMPQFGCATSSYNFTCTEEQGIFLIKVVPSTPLTSCSAPFTFTTSGCILVDPTPRTFGDSRMFCFQYGADLVSADSTQSVLNLRNYMVLTHPGTGEYWVGLERTTMAGDWRWVNSARVIGANLATELPGQSNASSEWYGRIRPTSYKADDGDCNKPFGVICEWKGL